MKKTHLDEIEPGVMAETITEVVHPRPALELLSRLRKGQVMDLLAIEIQRVVKAVEDTTTGKGGTVTLTLKINPVSKIANAVQVQAAIIGKAPEDPPTSDLLWHDHDGNLFPRDPNQGDMLGPRGT